MLVETIRETIESHGLIPDGAEVVAAVSGGADSVALLQALHQLGIPCTVAHLNHKLRGSEADTDEAFVRKLAGELGLPIAVKTVDVRGMAEQSGLSIEMAARQARHGFFAEFEDAVIAMAHHADDQVETCILKLARGAGPEGLGGMSYSQRIGAIQLIRPMLDIPRETILQWLEELHFHWREDASNSDETILRNKVRHTILPLLERELNPNIRETILRTMNILREENEWMSSIVHEASCFVASEEAGLNTTKQDASPTLPLAARRRALRMWIFDQGVEEAGFDAVNKILALMDSGEGSTIFELSDRQRVVVEYGIPRVEHAGQASQPALGGQGCLPHIRMTIEKGTGWRKDRGHGVGILPAEASFDADKVGDAPIEVRAWRPGDRMNPLGMEGGRKLQDIFTDQKVPRAQRSGIPVVTCRGEIIWLPGYRTARGWEVQGRDGNAVHVRLNKPE